MSSTNSVLWHTMSKHLFPTTTYHYNSGGEPEDIPKLSYEQLKDFYETHYHPSNAVFMTFGDIPAREHQEKFETLALSKFERLDTRLEVADEQRYSEPLRVQEYYAVDESDDPRRTHVVVGWLLGPSIELRELFEAQLLTSVLLDHSASPLLQVLETSPLGSSPSPMCGLEDSHREMTFMAGLEGCSDDSTEEVEQLLLSTLEAVCETGIEQEQVEGALHQLELSQREISGDSYPYGLQLILTGLSTALHRGDPIRLLDLDPVLEELRERVKEPDFIPGLIRKLLLDNPHRLTLTLSPDTELDRNKVAREREDLAKIKSEMDDATRDKILAQSKALSERQSQEDDPGLLPKVGLDDVPAELQEPTRVPGVLSKSGAEVSFYGQGTNGLGYQQVVVEMPELSDELLEILPLYTTCLPELGVGRRDYAETQTWQARISGGINCFTSVRGHADDVQTTEAFLSFSSKALIRNHEALSELLHETFDSVRFDEDQRLLELVEQIAARKENSITGQGHSLAMSLASSKMSPCAWLNHSFGGLLGIQWIKALRRDLQEPAQRQALLERFQRLHALVQAGRRQFLLIGEEHDQAAMQKDLEKHWQQPVPDAAERLVLPPVRKQVREAWTTATQVNFCAKAFPTVPASHPDNAGLHVLAGLLRNGFLHRTIREQGGAYGAGAGQDANSGSFRFFSYRDPRLGDTLADFDRGVAWVVDNPHKPQQLEEAILGVISAMDKSTSPAGEAKQAFYNHLFGRSLEMRSEFRARVLDTSLDDLRRLAEQYLRSEQASIGVISNRESQSALEALQLETVNL